MSNTYIGQPHPTFPSEMVREDTELTSIEYHLLKHTLDHCWQQGTTPTEYLADIRAAVLHGAAILDVGGDRVHYPGGQERRASRAATRTDAQSLFSTLPAAKLEVMVGRCVFVIYDPVRAKLLSGYTMPSKEAGNRVAMWTPRYTL